ncbi:helix-turn-helix domain-containing protein [Nocardia sp. CA-120079]|uniref:helix-turn-helix domain-containing protein n=1 Tax=Nocardia sp. CA-120079 TaxID=3239974 RepID=UPI003D96188C
MTTTQNGSSVAQPRRGVASPDTATRQRRTRRNSGAGRGDRVASNGGRGVAWAGFIFGAVLSVAANWLHTWLPAATMPDGWHPGVAPQIGSAVWPIGLLLSVEVLSRTRWRRGLGWMLARYIGAGSVALGSAVISYGHVHDVLLNWGYGAVGAAVGPIVLDGLMVISGFAMLSESTPSDTTATPAPVATAVRNTQPDSATPQRDTTATTPETFSDDDRDNHIRAMYRQCNSTREVGEAFGLHHSTVARIVGKPDTPAAKRDGRDNGRASRDAAGDSEHNGFRLIAGGTIPSNSKE